MTVFVFAVQFCFCKFCFSQVMHLGSLIARYLQHTRCAEMCTQAWCKFHEIVGTFPAIARLSATRQLNTVHLCEAPGAFITSLNHFLVCQGLLFVAKSYSDSLFCEDVSTSDVSLSLVVTGLYFSK